MVLLELAGVSVSYPTRGMVLDHVSMSIRDGEIACILGPTGCGKTSTLKVISGLLKPTTGRVTVDGRSFAESDELQIG